MPSWCTHGVLTNIHSEAWLNIKIYTYVLFSVSNVVSGIQSPSVIPFLLSLLWIWNYDLYPHIHQISCSYISAFPIPLLAPKDWFQWRSLLVSYSGRLALHIFLDALDLRRCSCGGQFICIGHTMAELEIDAWSGCSLYGGCRCWGCLGRRGSRLDVCPYLPLSLRWRRRMRSADVV